MSRPQDTFALLKGLQLVVKACARTNEEYLRLLWANSSVRDVINSNCTQAKEFTNRITMNPTKEFENVSKILKETVERSSVVAEGVRQYTLTNSKVLQQMNEIKEKPKEIIHTVTNPGSLDISALTLKELEQYLSNQYNTNGEKSILSTPTPSTVKATAASASIHPPPAAATAAHPAEAHDPRTFLKDEKYVQDWMRFISKHDPMKSTEPVESAKSSYESKKTSEPVESATLSYETMKPSEPIVSARGSLKDEKVESKENPKIKLPELSTVAKQRKVPSSRIARMASFGGLFAGLGLGTAAELTKGALGLGGSTDAKSALLSPRNAERIVDTLCRVRGAALKLGQVLSIQDSSIVSPQLVKAFDRVRQAADYMPDWQVEKALKTEFGNDWRSKLKEFDGKPFAAASIGQVHRGRLLDGTEVAIKIQYPGVAKSIESDIDNLVGMLKVWDVFPAGIFIDNIVKVAKRELVWEVDYLREANYTEKYAEMVARYKEYKVPKVYRELTTKSVLTTELVPGVPLDKCFDLSYEHRYRIGKSILDLCLRELFELNCMQTDPNWSNFLYDVNTKTVMLIDFGSTRFYTNDFIENYRATIVAAINNDYDKVLDLSRKMQFLTGYETKQMERAHVDAVMILGEMFRCNGEFDFGRQNTTKEIASLVPTMIAHRLCPPPEEIYSIHRKLSGVFLLCAKLNIKIDCRPIYNEIIKK